MVTIIDIEDEVVIELHRETLIQDRILNAMVRTKRSKPQVRDQAREAILASEEFWDAVRALYPTLENNNMSFDYSTRKLTISDVVADMDAEL